MGRRALSSAAWEKVTKTQDLLPPLVDCRQGEKNLLFSSEEMENRLGKLRKHMAENNLDACIMTSYHNIAYYGEFLFCQFGRPYGLVVTHDDSTSVSASEYMKLQYLLERYEFKIFTIKFQFYSLE